MSERLLVCGGRDFSDRRRLFSALDAFAETHSIAVVIEGEAPGADTLAKEWAEQQGIPVEPYPALWKVYGKPAGPIRNQQMIDEGRPTYGIAFYDRPKKESRGTSDMVRRLKRWQIPVEEFLDIREEQE